MTHLGDLWMLESLPIAYLLHFLTISSLNEKEWRAMTDCVDVTYFWNKQYEQLVEFKRKHGNCLVPRRHHEDTFLGKWVANKLKNST
jgi:hypothetical protein